MMNYAAIQREAERRIERWARNYSAFLADPVRRLEAAMRQQEARERSKRMMELVRPMMAEMDLPEPMFYPCVKYASALEKLRQRFTGSELELEAKLLHCYSAYQGLSPKVLDELFRRVVGYVPADWVQP